MPIRGEGLVEDGQDQDQQENEQVSYGPASQLWHLR